MNERQTDLALVGVFLAGVVMMVSIALTSRLAIVCAVIAVAGFAIAKQKGTKPFSPEVRRQLRGIVLGVAAVCGIALLFSYLSSCVTWLAFIALTVFTYMSLRVRIFGPAPPRAE
ncbi:MAG TPA: hypothetical protein VF384_06510 [Planctomycetota bacterium]